MGAAVGLRLVLCKAVVGDIWPPHGYKGDRGQTPPKSQVRSEDRDRDSRVGCPQLLGLGTRLGVPEAGMGGFGVLGGMWEGTEWPGDGSREPGTWGGTEGLGAVGAAPGAERLGHTVALGMAEGQWGHGGGGAEGQDGVEKPSVAPGWQRDKGDLEWHKSAGATRMAPGVAERHWGTGGGGGGGTGDVGRMG